MRLINIRAVLNGFVVKVGCREVVFESKSSLLVALTRYVENPEEVEKEFLSKALYQTKPEPDELDACGTRGLQYIASGPDQ